MSNEKKELVFEVGMEELPSPYFDCIYREEKKLSSILVDNGLFFDTFKIYVTPRRMVFYVAGVPVVQEEKEEIKKGPGIDQAYDTGGNPSKALIGFVKSAGVDIKDIFQVEESKRTRVAVKVKSGGGKAADVFCEILPRFLSAFIFPRNMGWNDSCIRFPRPIRWLFCMFGDETIPVEVAGLRASNVSFGHRYVSKSELVISNASEYFTKLEFAKIILDEEKRIDKIRAGLKIAAESKGWASFGFNEDLIKTVSRLTEQPYVVHGGFREEYLDLPSDVLATCMKKHQKIFACYDKNGSLVNSFLGVIDGKRKRDDLIQAGYENVLESRLRDASFFIKEDMKEPLEASVPRMKEITFLGKMGTFADKINRMNVMCDAVGSLARFGKDGVLSSDNILHLKEAAKLCKVDLVSHIVFEFPELQGIAGREYLKREGKHEEVYRAVSNHYLPLTLSDDINVAEYSTKEVGWVSALLGIIDRLDTVVGALGSGIEISGSEDPFALRRASGGIVKIMRAFDVQVSLRALVDKAIDSFGGCLTVEENLLVEKVFGLLKDRLVYEAQEKSGSVERMILDGVIEASCDDIADVFARLEALKSVYSDEGKRELFVKAVKIAERTKNITKSMNAENYADVSEELLKEVEEKALFSAVINVKDRILQLIAGKFYDKAICTFADSLNDVVHAFFDKVLVNVDDVDIRLNRQRLLFSINKMVSDQIADLSVIHGL